MKNLETIKIVEQALQNTRKTLLKNRDFKKERAVLKTMKYNQKSIMRKYGSEHYFKVIIFNELIKILDEKYTVSVETRFKFGDSKQKIADIVIWKNSIKDSEPLAIIELKVTGYLFFIDDKKTVYQKDLEIYNNNHHLTEGETQFFSICYYESLPSEIIARTEPVFKSFSDLKIHKKFRDKIVEIYAFQGPIHEWKTFK